MVFMGGPRCPKLSLLRDSQHQIQIILDGSTGNSRHRGDSSAADGVACMSILSSSSSGTPEQSHFLFWVLL